MESEREKEGMQRGGVRECGESCKSLDIRLAVGKGELKVRCVGRV